MQEELDREQEGQKALGTRQQLSELVPTVPIVPPLSSVPVVPLLKGRSRFKVQGDALENQSNSVRILGFGDFQ